MSLLSKTLGRVIPRYRTFSDWVTVYRQIIDARPIQPKTLQNRNASLRRLTLDEWQRIYAWSQANQPSWASRMILLALVTGQRRADLRLEAIGVSLGEAIELCRDYAPPGEYLLRKSTGERPVCPSLSARFEDAREGVYGKHTGAGLPPCLHECRSLAERLYRKQGIDTRTLLGHKRQSMTDTYNDDRGLSDGEWKTLEV